MRGPGWFRSVRSPQAGRQAAPGSRRDRLAVVLAFLTAVCLGSVFLFSKGTAFLMPGPLSSAHGAIEKCSACHSNSGSGKLSWINGLNAGDPRADGKACLTCHKMPDTAFNAHSAPADVLEKSTQRLTKVAARLNAPRSARAQSFAFPTDEAVARGLTCATCHQEHQGTTFNLNKMSGEQCRSCHVAKFDSFDGHHPKFDNYPFERRTRITYDHAGHFNKHYPELVKKDPSKHIPETCSTCHNSRADKRIMAVAPFDQTCASCHLDQIAGKERVSGPKGIAFLSLPGLDLETLKQKKAPIGEWPDGSEAALTPFMKVMISRNEQGLALVKSVDGINLQDLTTASDDQIKAVTNLVWEIKRLFHALISGKASDVLADLNIVRGAKLSAPLVADLTASIPRDVVIGAQQQWLPSLASEIANGPITTDQQPVINKQEQSQPVPDKTDAKLTEPDAPAEPSGSDESEAPSGTEAPASEAASPVKLDPPACTVRVFGQCLVYKEQQADAAKPNASSNETPNGSKVSPSASALPEPMRAGLRDAGPAAELRVAAATPETANTKPVGGETVRTAETKPAAKAGDQSDDLLILTEEELRAMKARGKGAGKADEPDRVQSAPTNAPAASNTPVEKPQTPVTPVLTIESGVDPESWAEYGGWYRQDFAIFYRPTGHKDKFIYSWLFLTGPQAPKADTSPAAAVFDYLIGKDAQGSCTKCHSVDDIQGKGRVVNFSPPMAESKLGRFTNFIHEPHFGILDNRGCLSCHKLEKDQPGAVAVKTETANAKSVDAGFADAAFKAKATAPAQVPADSPAVAASTDAEKGVSLYLKSYEQGNPHTFTSEFSSMKKDLCQTCHNSSKARQDCLTCHKYHVNGVVTPIMSTKNPTQ